MPKAPRKPLTDELADLSTLPPPEDNQIDEFFDEIAPLTAYIEIFRMKDDGRRPQLGRVTLDLLREDPHAYLRTKYGAGRYLLVGKNSQNRFVRSKIFEVENEILAPVAAVSPSAAGSLDRELMSVLIANLRPPVPPPPMDIGGLLQGLALIQPKAPDVTTMLTAVVTAIATLRPSDNGKQEDILEKLPKILEIVKAFTPENSSGGKEENLYSVVKDVGLKVVDAMKPRVAELPPGALPAQLPAATATPSQDPETMFQTYLRAQLNFLKSKALAGKDSDRFAEYILDNDDEPGNNAILTALERGATFEHLCEFDPDISRDPNLNQWFRNLYASLSRAMSAPPEAETDLAPGRPSGNLDDPATHAGASPSAESESKPAGRKPPVK